MASGQKEIGELVRKYTKELATSASDLMLFAIYFNLDLGANSEHSLDQEMHAAITSINFSSFKRSLTHLKSKGLITEADGTTTGFALTELGQKEIANTIPMYHEERSWDGKIYLINYDLPVTKNTLRNAFRDYIKEIGSGMLQHSLWLNPYDPREKLAKYISENELDNKLVIVSAIGVDTEMYQFQMMHLVEQSFNLSEINERYRAFIKLANQGITRERKIFEFLHVLRDDPQVPYDLLPQDWAGYEAYEIFKSVK